MGLYPVGPGGALLFCQGMSYETFTTDVTAVRQQSLDLFFWKMYEVLREANPDWNPPTEGIEPSG